MQRNALDCAHMARSAADPLAGAPVCTRVDVRRSSGAARAPNVADAGGRLLALWADAAPRESACTLAPAPAVRGLLAASTCRCRAGDDRLPEPRATVSRRGTDAARGRRPPRHRRDRRRHDAAGCATRRGRADHLRCATRSAHDATAARQRRRLRLRARRGRRRARDRRRAGACGHHRAGPLPLLGRRREGAAARGAPRLRAQGHRTALHRAAAAGRAPPGRPRIGRLGGRLLLGLLSGAGRHGRHDVTAARRWLARAGARARAHRQPPGRPRRARQRCRLRLRSGPVLAAEGAAAARARARRSASAICWISSCRAASRATRRADWTRCAGPTASQRHRARSRDCCARSTTSMPACRTVSSAPVM